MVMAVAAPMEIAVPGGAAISQGPPEAVWLRDQGARAEEHKGPTCSPTS